MSFKNLNQHVISTTMSGKAQKSGNSQVSKASIQQQKAATTALNSRYAAAQ